MKGKQMFEDEETGSVRVKVTERHRSAQISVCAVREQYSTVARDERGELTLRTMLPARERMAP